IFRPSNHTCSPSLNHWWCVRRSHEASAVRRASYATCRASIICSRRVVIWGNGDFVISQVARGSYPMSRRKGDVFVVALYHVLCANSATGRYVAQFVCLWLVQNRRYCSSHWFVHSDCPSVLGWYA